MLQKYLIVIFTCAFPVLAVPGLAQDATIGSSVPKDVAVAEDANALRLVILRLQDEIAAFQSERTALDSEVTSTREALETLVNQKKVAESDLALSLQTRSEMESEVEDAREALNTILTRVEAASQKEDLLAAAEVLMADEAALEKIRGQKDQLAKEVSDLLEQKSLHQALSSELTGVQDRLEVARGEFQALVEELKTESLKLDGIRAQRDEVEKLVEQELARQGEARDSTQMIEDSLVDLTSRHDEMDAKVSRLEAVHEGLERRMEEMSGLRERLLGELAEASEQKGSLLSEIERLLGERDGLSADVGDLKSDQSALTAAVTAAEAQLNDLLARVSEAESQLEPEQSNVSEDVSPADVPPAQADITVKTRNVSLAGVPGLDDVSDSQTLRLKALLDAGQCPTDALQDALGNINRQTLLYLMRELGPC